MCVQIATRFVLTRVYSYIDASGSHFREDCAWLFMVSPVEARLCCLICFIFSPKALVFVFTWCFGAQLLMSFTSTGVPTLDDCAM